MKKLIVVLLALLLMVSGCGSQNSDTDTQTYRIGICNFVDDASLNQIADNIQRRLNELAAQNSVELKIYYDNPNADANVMAQIISNFITDNVDIMVGIATPVAAAMQGATEDNNIPVIFSAVSDPVNSKLVDSLAKPGANISGTSDYLNTEALLQIILAVDPDIRKVGLLYDIGQDSSTGPVQEARQFFSARGIEIVEKTGTNVDEIKLAAQALIQENVEAVFTPTDNTVMTAELSIYESFAEAGIPHYCGADSFALNGAFLGYGVDYSNLGVETANMVFEVLVNGRDISSLPVMTFDNGIATINTETCVALGLDFAEISSRISGFCTAIQEIQTNEEFQN